ncbi:MAG TPA: pilin [Candidatus Saccharimonadales bacterium]|nr:pilin [Candidatus Saccharimonadales bacterium]
MDFAIRGNKLIFCLLALFAGLILVFSFSPVLHAATENGSEGEAQGESQEADIQNATCSGADLKFTSNPDGNECAFGGLDANEKLNRIISEIINFFSVIIGVVAVLMIIVGGFRYIISGGDTGNVTSAKNTILYAIIGLIVVVFAQVIVKFILSKAVDIAS